MILPQTLFINPVFPTLPRKIPSIFPVKVTYKTSTKKNAKAKTKKLTYTLKVAKVGVALSGDSVVAIGSTTKLTNTKKNSSRAKITYTSSDDSIATVAADGTVTGVKAGKVTITAKIAVGKDSAETTKDVEVKNVILKSAAQKKASQIVATFAGDTSKLDKKDITITNTANNVVYDSWILDGRGWYTYKYVVNQLKKGSYSVEYVFDQETKFDAKIVQLSNNVSLSSNKLSITKGFVKTLKVNNGVATSWTSSNSSVASVNRKGKITGKKIGTTTVTAHLSDGKSLKCKVTIKANEYSGKKITIEDSGINEYTIRAYHAAYQANGNMVIKFRIANGTNKKITAIPKFHVSVINQKNKGIASYSNNSFKVNVPKHSVKEYSITIKKNSISGGKADLRNTNIEISGERVKL